MNELLDRKLYETTILSEIGRVARKMVSIDETFASVMSLVAQVVDFTIGGMVFIEGTELEMVFTLHRTAAPPVLEDMKARVLRVVSTLGKSPSFTRVQVRLLPSEGGTSGPIDTSLVAFAAFPIETNQRLTGLMVLGGRTVEKLDDEGRAFLSQLANQAHIVVENSRLFERVQNLAIRDSLTGLFNHRHTMELLAREVGRAERYQGPVSALMLDIDHFKKVNDEHGHLVGDGVLRDVARLLRAALRTVDSRGALRRRGVPGAAPADPARRGAAHRRTHAPADRRARLPGGQARAAGHGERGSGHLGRRGRAVGRGLDPRSRPGPLPGQGGGARPRRGARTIHEALWLCFMNSPIRLA